MNDFEITKNKNLEINIYYIITVWLIISILPQIFLLSREDQGNILVKMILMSFFIMVTIKELRKSNLRLGISKIIIWLYFLFTQIISNIILNFSSISNEKMTILNIIISSTYTLIFLVFFNKAELSKKKILDFSVLYTYFIVYASFYNIINNFNDLQNIFSTSRGYEYNFASFFGNRNTFGIFLAFGLFATYLLLDNFKKNNKTGRFFVKCSIVLILLNLFFTNSRTSMFLSLIFIILRAIMTYKKKLHKLFLRLIVVLLILSIILYFTDISTYLINIVIRPESGVSGRDHIWRESVKYFWANNIFFGSGETSTASAMFSVSGKKNLHNTFLTIINVGGISLLLWHSILIIKSAIRIKEIAKYDSNIGVGLAGMLLFYLFSSLTETNLLFNSSAVNVTATIFVVLIPKYYSNYLRSSY